MDRHTRVKSRRKLSSERIEGVEGIELILTQDAPSQTMGSKSRFSSFLAGFNWRLELLCRIAAASSLGCFFCLFFFCPEQISSTASLAPNLPSRSSSSSSTTTTTTHHHLPLTLPYSVPVPFVAGIDLSSIEEFLAWRTDRCSDPPTYLLSDPLCVGGCVPHCVRQTPSRHA
ncbi:hypothetical protein BDV26DRAFT_80938 [Aspergillus bertholletiae]|uniref:Uncharacterized protein n=1 Tax=Aspergillus bertholletiae TaxID=1226010 RepID=A0A5N7AVP0_9EURO|nr:hypothetical protein BDV26DRAFT_80938 [Aspergillus bertholletiae]